ncbi:hypothetical protein C2L80_13435, partial [Rubneribacter badeniensis]
MDQEDRPPQADGVSGDGDVRPHDQNQAGTGHRAEAVGKERPARANAMSISENEIALEDVPGRVQEPSCFEGPSVPDAGGWAAMAERLHPGASARPPLSRVPSRSYAHVKRVLDVALSLAAIVALSPVLLACAVAVKATSPGPVLFRQERWGRAGSRFECLKFRT